MSATSPTTKRSKRLHRKMPAGWWLGRWSYFVFMMRELSSVFVALVAVGTVLQVQALRSGEYASFNEMLASPWMIALGIVSLAFALLHTLTFFSAAGQVLVIRRGEMSVPKDAVVAGHFVGWLVVSAGVLWIVQ